MPTPVVPPSAPPKPVTPSPTIPPPAVPRRDTTVNPSTQTPRAPLPLTPDRRGRYSELRLFVAELDVALAAHDLGAVAAVVQKFKASSNLLAAEVQRDKTEAERRRR